MDKPVLVLKEIKKSYRRAGSCIQILGGISLEVRRGESIAVTGPSGSGKSTLLNIMGTLDTPDSGEVSVCGTAAAGLDDAGLCRIRREQIGFVFQQHHLLPQCNVLENVLMPALAGNAGTLPEEYARELILRAGLDARISHKPSELSGGECQRVALVRALVNRPAIVLADEPTGSLDRATAAETAGLMIRLNSECGTALVVVTHSARLAASMNLQYELRDGLLSRKEN